MYAFFFFAAIEIKLDAFVTSESCHSELCKALTVSSFPGARFRLIVERLCITCLGGDRVNLLLKQVTPEVSADVFEHLCA